MILISSGSILFTSLLATVSNRTCLLFFLFKNTPMNFLGFSFMHASIILLFIFFLCLIFSIFSNNGDFVYMLYEFKFLKKWSVSFYMIAFTFGEPISNMFDSRAYNYQSENVNIYSFIIYRLRSTIKRGRVAFLLYIFRITNATFRFYFLSVDSINYL